MAKLVFAMNVSLDGYVDHDKFEPDPVLFDHFVERTRNTAAAIYGRGLYEVMRYWDQDEWDQDDPARGPQLRAYAEAWRRRPKWVVSRSLQSVGPNATLIGGDLAVALRGLKADLDGVIEIGGTELAASATKLSLIDEYQLYVHPVVLGSGKPFFADVRPKLRLMSSERIGESAVLLSYVPA